MAWIEAHQSLQRHPKTVALSKLLGVTKMAAIGHLFSLWWWAVDYAPSGSLASVTDATIADACEWRKAPAMFVQALVDAKGPSGHGWLDEDRTLHDWDEYVGRLLRKRAADVERKRTGRSTEPPPEPPPEVGATAPVQTYRPTYKPRSARAREAENTAPQPARFTGRCGDCGFSMGHNDDCPRRAVSA